MELMILSLSLVIICTMNAWAFRKDEIQSKATIHMESTHNGISVSAKAMVQETGIYEYILTSSKKGNTGNVQSSQKGKKHIFKNEETVLTTIQLSCAEEDYWSFRLIIMQNDIIMADITRSNR
ncbi:curli-like amyloid fiber formation chaperone CsgH [Desulfobotulus alkaliphilus]|nr:curli-like amyloid fiber formation chaperone CsgH [Desulfobotulus alkaliphilus]